MAGLMIKADGMMLYPLELRTFPINIEHQTAVIVRREASAKALPAAIKQAIEKHSLYSSHLILLGRSENQDARAALEKEPLRVCVVGERDLTRLMLADDPATELALMVAAGADLGEISPYQTAGGLDNPLLFFGRRKLLSQIRGREARNYLLIGARQMGKSSILKELHRREPETSYLITSVRDDVEATLEAEGLPPLDELVERHKGGPPPMLLFDEADKLISTDRERGFEQLQRFRSLSEAGKCRVVLAGYWQLYRSAYLDYHSPLRNLAEPITLGPLDRESARQLATRPLEPLGVTWAKPELIEELLDRVGNRPNLVALACDAAIQALEPLSDRQITAKILHSVLDLTSRSGRAFADTFQIVTNLTGDPDLNRLDKKVMSATVTLETFTKDDLRAQLRQSGAEVDDDALEQSLRRLTLAFVLDFESGRYSYPVPMIRDYLVHIFG